jgi:hypothetical protein
VFEASIFLRCQVADVLVSLCRPIEMSEVESDSASSSSGRLSPGSSALAGSPSPVIISPLSRQSTSRKRNIDVDLGMDEAKREEERRERRREKAPRFVNISPWILLTALQDRIRKRIQREKQRREKMALLAASTLSLPRDSELAQVRFSYSSTVTTFYLSFWFSIWASSFLIDEV